MAEIPTPDLAVPYLPTVSDGSQGKDAASERDFTIPDLRGADTGEYNGGCTSHCPKEWGVDWTQLGGGGHLDQRF